MYRNNNYSRDTGSWIYIDGELYHAGVKGMQWGKHLPGTDWWKQTTMQNLGRIQTQRGNSGDFRGPGRIERVRANLRTAGQAAKLYGGYLKNNTRVLGRYAKSGATKAYGIAKNAAGKAYNAGKNAAVKAYGAARKGTSKLYNAAKGYSAEKINQMRESARNHYQGVKTKVHGVLDKSYGKVSEIYNNPSLLLSSKGDNKNYLTEWVQSAAYKANGAYSNALANGPIGNMFNSFFQNGKVSAMAASAKLLDRLGLDDEVDALIKKWSNKGKK